LPPLPRPWTDHSELCWIVPFSSSNPHYVADWEAKELTLSFPCLNLFITKWISLWFRSHSPAKRHKAIQTVSFRNSSLGWQSEAILRSQRLSNLELMGVYVTLGVGRPTWEHSAMYRHASPRKKN
jgi:hypothetical protein